jgi:hypothetical protein
MQRYAIFVSKKKLQTESDKYWWYEKLSHSETTAHLGWYHDDITTIMRTTE